MQYIFAGDSGFEQKLKRANYIFLCADFDGTLTPLKPRPGDVQLEQKVRLLLRQLVQKEYIFAGIISGRSLKDLKSKVGLPSLIYAGNHGLEIAYRGRVFIHPQGKKYTAVIAKICRKLKRELAAFPGAVLEDKHLSLSLHHRLIKGPRLSRLRKIFLTQAQPYLRQKKMRLTYGKKVWELRPPLTWDKGQALLWLVRRLPGKKILTIFMGDDLTDEDGFRAVNKIGGLSIFIGKKKVSCAKYYLRGTKDARKFLKLIARIKS